MKRLLLLSLLILFNSCEKDPVKYSLLVNVNPPASGIVNPSQGNYEAGETITIFAQPNQYFAFKNWTGQLTGNNSTIILTIDTDKSITANFEKIDIDEDGVLNINDLCPGSNGSNVDSNGCALNQKDTDGDGVTDDLDICENTSSSSEIVNSSGCKVDLFFLDENSITIKAIDEAEPGMIDTINGKQYIIVDNQTLREYIQEYNTTPYVPDFMVTSKVTDMSYLLKEKSLFNTTELRNWDVSNVENFEGMFQGSKPYIAQYVDTRLFLDTWDTSSALNMNYMFENTREIGVYEVGFGYYEFVGIENWDVSNVEEMMRMFNRSSFNQPIGNWDVGNVWNMSGLFMSSPFNQPIGDWDVGNVMISDAMFMYGSFNQPIGDWDVSNISNMSGMFLWGYGMPSQQQIGPATYQSVPPDNPFNQDISNWDTSSVTNMSQMFQGTVMNQDLSNWNVNNVGACIWFAKNTPNWTLPKPNFINCNVDPN
jgi:hypothetical protein